MAELDGVRTTHTWVPDIALRLDPAPLDVEVEPIDTGYLVTVTATSLARDITLLADRLDPAATVDLGLVTLPAGSTATFHVRTAVPDLADALTAPPVLRSANEVSRSSADALAGSAR